jgi:hypothetical protein
MPQPVRAGPQPWSRGRASASPIRRSLKARSRGPLSRARATTSSAAPDPVPPGNVPTVDVVGRLDGRGSRLVYILRS